jgi:hypothetical protein
MIIVREKEMLTNLSTNIYRAYENLRTRILLRILSHEDLDIIGQIVKDKNERASAEQLIEKILLNAESKKESYYDELYKVLITARPNSELLYSFLQFKMDKVFKEYDVSKMKRPAPWTWAFLGNAMVLAYQYTREERFLSLFISSYDRILLHRDSERGLVDGMRNRIMQSWSSNIINQKSMLSRLMHKTVRTNEMTTAGLMTYPAARFILTVMNDETMKDKYEEQTTSYLKTVEDAVNEFRDEFHLVPGTSRGYYRMPYENEVEPLNHSHAMGATLAYLYAITNKIEYRNMVEQIADYFIASMRKEENGSYSWGYWPTPQNMNKMKSEEFWKARTTLMLPLAAYECGIAFTESDMKAFTKTFKYNIYRGNNQFNVYISRKDFVRLDPNKLIKKFRNRPQTLANFMFLDKFDPEIRSIIENAVAGRIDLFPGGWFGSGNIAQVYSYRLKEGSKEG